MLALYEKTQAIPGVIVYRDHQDLGQFYYICEVPRISKVNGTPALSFVKFRRDITDNVDFQEGDSLGGGILNFTVDLAVTEDELDDIRNEIPDHFDNVPDEIRLAPVTVRDGSVRLSVMRDSADAEGASADAPRGLKFFEEVHGSTKPSLIGDQRATFTVMLNREMATAMEQTLRGGISMFGVLYQLFFMGMRDAFSIKARADYKRVYTHMETELGVQAQIKAVSLAADIGVAFQRLREKGIVKVEITQFTDDEDLKAQQDEAWEWIKNELIKDLFETSMSPPGFMQPDAGGGMLGQLQNLFGQMPVPTLGAAMQPQRGAVAQTPPNTGAPASNLSDQVASTAATNQTQAAARAPAGGGGNAISEISPFRVGFSLKVFHQDELKVREFDFTMQAAMQQEANPNGMFSSICDGYNLDKHIFEIDMDDPWFDRVVSTVSMGQDLASLGIASVAVNMEYPADRPANRDADHIDGFLFRPGETDSRSFTTFVNDRNDRDYRYRMTITFDPTTEWRGKDSQIVTDWTATADRQLPLAPMDAIELMQVEIGLSSLSNDLIAQVEVEVAYENPVTGFTDQRTFVLTPGGAAQTWKLRLGADAPLEYRYRLRYFFREGNLRIETPFETSQEPALVVNPPFRGLQRVTINPMLLDAPNLLQAVVDISYTEDDSGYRVSYREEYDGMTPLAVRRIEIPTLAEDPAPVEFSSTVIKIDGSVSTQENQTVENGIILLTEGPGTVQRIRLKLPQQSLGDMIAIKVALTGSGDLADETSALFTPSQMADQFVSLVQPDGAAREYSFAVTGYDVNGDATELATGTTNDQVFIVPMS
ncbi:MAG: hypothetical protein RID11_20685 [Roseovarius sp.]|uniref:hypothetical protein n=1 Tax=Roseovarius sp. TaxID=1486281 RepID=UPI0032ECA153